MKTLCFHHNDWDGNMAAAVCMLAGVTNFYEVAYDLKEEDAIAACKDYDLIYMVDFSPKQSLVDKLCETKFVTIIDHHFATSSLKAHDHLSIVYDHGPNIAGCSLTWQFMFPDKAMPALVQLCASYDSWAWITTDPCRKAGEYNAAFWFYKYSETDTVALFNRMLRDCDYIPNGFENASLLFDAAYLEACAALRRGKEMLIHGHKVFVINAPAPDMPNVVRTLNQDFPQIPLLAWHMRSNGTIKCSLRVADNDSGSDASKIAGIFNGGGHRKAAAFYTNMKVMAELPWD